jgi:hypothetical protein
LVCTAGVEELAQNAWDANVDDVAGRSRYFDLELGKILAIYNASQLKFDPADPQNECGENQDHCDSARQATQRLEQALQASDAIDEEPSKQGE